jgi:hypothetical protein
LRAKKKGQPAINVVPVTLFFFDVAPTVRFTQFLSEAYAWAALVQAQMKQHLQSMSVDEL